MSIGGSCTYMQVLNVLTMRTFLMMVVDIHVQSVSHWAGCVRVIYCKGLVVAILVAHYTFACVWTLRVDYILCVKLYILYKVRSQSI